MTMVMWMWGEGISIYPTDMEAGQLLEEVNEGKWQPPPSARQCLDRHTWRGMQFNDLVILLPADDHSLAQRARARTSRLNTVAKLPLAMPLSPRQQQVLRGLLQGLTTRQIAAQLGLRPRTVLMHVAAIKTRLQAATRAQLAGRVFELGWDADLEE
jgi:DNA-binding NarL/FixJ family response regulator